MTRVVIDTSPDLREQLIDAEVDHLDAVFLTHEHADQTHGIDDLRSVVLHQRRRIPVYLNQSTAKDIMHAVFLLLRVAAGQRLSADPRPAFDRGRREPRDRREGRSGLAVRPSSCSTAIFRRSATGSRDAAYTPDVSDIPRESWPHLENLDLWIIDGLRYAAHPSHFSVNDALSWIDRFKPRRAVITNMHSDLDYEVLRQSLPPNVIPAYDGMRLTLGA